MKPKNVLKLLFLNSAQYNYIQYSVVKTLYYKRFNCCFTIQLIVLKINEVFTIFVTLSNSVNLYYKKIGQGNPLILLHGNGDSHEDLEKLGQALARNFTVYLIDSRGHGKSSNHNEYFVYEDLAMDIDLFIRHFDLKDVNVIGHSDGAIIAALLAIQNKIYLSKIILLGITMKPEQMKPKWTKWIQKEYEENHHPLFRLMIEEPQIEFSALENINIPTLVVAADDDVMELESYIQIANHISTSELYILENEDHMSYVVNTDKFADKAINFLQ